MKRYALTIFLGAFLVFQVQPIVAKRILPWFGGSPSVWTTCLLFFQTALLAGYAYAHLISTRLRPARQAVVHAAVLGLALIALPISPDPRFASGATDAPAPRILALLAAGVGLPYVALSATAPLLQAWRGLTHPGAPPYRLYALSNLGSLLALMSYPVVFEPSFEIRAQENLWSACFVAFAVGAVACGLQIARIRDDASTIHAGLRAAGGEEADASQASPALWVALPALASLLLVAATNQLCRDVAVVPFLWVLPLALYLVTFILCFESDRWYRRPLFTALLSVAAPVACIVARGAGRAPLVLQVGVHLSTVFVACMCCHGELARARPPARRLTGFYLAVAAGGAVGGAFAALAAPAIFAEYDEYLVAIAGIYFLTIRAYLRETRGPASRLARVGPVVLAIALAAGYELRASIEGRHVVERARNFYGVLRVTEGTTELSGRRFRTLVDGQTRHGLQFLDEAGRRIATTYYGPLSGGALAIRRHPAREGRGLRVGLVGLGTGTLAVYGRAGDALRFYELNPDVVRLARERFSFLGDARAAVEVVPGDARITLEQEVAAGAPPLDALVVDAFSGDAVPAHLLTREAGALYARRLAPKGVLAFHLTNRHLDLVPVVRALARDLGRRAAWVHEYADPELGRDDASWVVVSGDEAFFGDAEVASALAPWPEGSPEPILWTDGFSSHWPVQRR
jgi:hypothetical protein